MEKLSSRTSALRYFLILFLPTATVICSLLYLSHQYEQDIYVDNASTTQRILVRTLAQQLGNEIQSSVVPELLRLSEDPRLMPLLELRTTSSLDAFGAVMLGLARHHQIYDQIRLIDDQGQEVIRVNGHGSNAQRVSTDRLQNKSGRYYFEDTLRLDPKQVYVSRLDLNVEGGEVEQPFKPMIRIGTPVVDAAGRKRGILLFNYRAQKILDIIESRGQSDGAMVLINSEGYWLKGLNPDHEWSFMWPERRQYTFAQRFPTIWPSVQSNRSFQVLLSDGMLSGIQVDPFPENTAVDRYSAPHWVLGSWLPMRSLMQAPNKNLPFRIMIGTVFLVLALAASIALGRVISKRNKNHAQLRRANRSQSELIDQLKQAQAQLVQSEKMAGIGQLAAGVAHEINNPVGFVASNLNTFERYVEQLLEALNAHERLLADAHSLEQLREQVDQTAEQQDLAFLREDVGCVIAETQDGIRRIKRIVADLKGFARDSEDEWEIADLHQELERTLNLVNNELKYHCTLHKHYDALPQIECIASELNQVLVNLLVNAAQAIPEKGNITLRTGVEGNRIWLEVEDDGKGIDLADLDRVFEPFFTTKPVGKGTGLGLSISYGIIKKHNGTIEVRSRKGEGSCFRLTLPIKQRSNEQVDEKVMAEGQSA
ncbi:ATP-binding protein [Motiliproteus sp.]|uniref:ATP-binding protein n=1 Tax=Motiliproteus sp. TaxID=1898955 RepID=UPI003BAD42B9